MARSRSFRSWLLIAAACGPLAPMTARADSPLYEIVRSSVFDLDALLAKQGITVDSCQFVHLTDVNLGWPIPQIKGMDVRDSKRLGSCLFDNAFENLSSPKPAGHVRAKLYFKGDISKDSKTGVVTKSAPTQFFISWRPKHQVVSPPKHWSEFIFPAGWAARNVKQALDAAQHYLDHEIVMRPLQPIPAGKLMGNEFIARLEPNGKPILIEKIVFRMENLSPEEIREELRKGVKNPVAKGVFLAYTPGMQEPSFAQEFMVHDLSVQPELRLDRGPWKLLKLRTQFEVATQTPGFEEEEPLLLHDVKGARK